MKMIIGGAYQGKMEYARNHFSITWVDGSVANKDAIMKAQGVFHFHEFIKRELQSGNSIDHLAEEIYETNPEMLIVSDEVGYGVVPVDKFERSYREAVGRVCTKLASCSTQVIRVVCGVGVIIKNA